MDLDAFVFVALFLALVLAVASDRWSDVTESFRRPRARRRGPWIQTITRGRWYPFDAQPGDVDLDAFDAVAWINRWGGHARACSVAEHMVRVAEWLRGRGYNPWVQLQGALHDVEEIFPPHDMAAPALSGPWWITWGMKWMRRKARTAVYQRLCLPRELHPAVHEADIACLSTEAHDRLPGGPLPEFAKRLPEPAKGLTFAWEPEYALYRWWSLVGQLAAHVADDRDPVRYKFSYFSPERRAAMRELAEAAERGAQRAYRAWAASHGASAA